MCSRSCGGHEGCIRFHKWVAGRVDEQQRACALQNGGLKSRDMEIRSHGACKISSLLVAPPHRQKTSNRVNISPPRDCLDKFFPPQATSPPHTCKLTVLPPTSRVLVNQTAVSAVGPQKKTRKTITASAVVPAVPWRRVVGGRRWGARGPFRSSLGVAGGGLRRGYDGPTRAPTAGGLRRAVGRSSGAYKTPSFPERQESRWHERNAF